MPLLKSALADDHALIKVKPFIASLTIVFFADSIMAYAFPVWVEETVGSATILGLIMALSSVFGIACDLLFPQFLKVKHWRRQLLMAISVAVIFPLTTYFGLSWNVIALLLVASAAWGIYYELLFFAEGNFIVDTVEKKQFSRTWAVINLASGITKVISPILAALVVDTPMQLIAMVLLFHVIGLVPLFFIRSRQHLTERQAEKDAQQEHVPSTKPALSHFNLFKEVSSWRTLMPSVYPVVFTGILIHCVDAAFWTVGALFGEHMFREHALHIGPLVLDHRFAWLPLFLFLVPSLFGSLILLKANITERKKRYAELLVVAAGAALVLNWFLPWSIFSLVPFFLTGLFMDWAYPLNRAVYSDLIKRAHGFQEDLVGLSQANSSIAYIMVPLVAGALADTVGYWNTFFALGLLLLIGGSILLMVTPRKIRLPQAAMNEG